MRKLTEAVPLETWQQIIDRAVTAALDGDDKARVWLSKYLLGEKLPTLAKLHAMKIEGVDEVEEKRGDVRRDKMLAGMAG